MKEWLTKLDLERTIILISALLMPVAGGWVYYLHSAIGEGEVARYDAIRHKGHIMQIAQRQKQISQFKKGDGAHKNVKDPRTFFERMVRKSQLANPKAGGEIGASDFKIIANEAKRVPRNQKLRDWTVEVQFRKGGNKPYAVGWSFINALVVNSESQSRIWKLRDLRMVNEQLKEFSRKKELPPAEVKDWWFPEKVVFARREPMPQKKPK